MAHVEQGPRLMVRHSSGKILKQAGKRKASILAPSLRPEISIASAMKPFISVLPWIMCKIAALEDEVGLLV
jgi:hypothetical protein